MLFDQLCVFFRSVVVTCYSISCVTFFDQLWLHVIRSVVRLFSISRGYMLFDQLCDFFRSVVVTCYSISCVSFRSVVVTCYSISCVTFFDQLWLHVIRSVVCLFSISRGYMLFDQLCDQLWLHFSISCGCMLFDQLCVFFRSVVVTCYSISCVSFFDQSWLHVIRSVVSFFDQLWLHVIRSVV